ncbi:MAG: GNAT family N-acetyltransferase [Anaerolineae bacterium]
MSTPYQQTIDSSLVLKSVRDAGDAERLAVFNGKTFGEGVTGMSRALLLHHPTTHFDYWLYVEDQTTGQIVSSLALIPWQWRYEEITLNAGEMGIVSTLEAYRGRGLIRALDKRFKELLRRDGFDLSQIEGIPYFYRQFGYEYAIPLEPNWHLELHHIPDAPPAAYSFRRATADDIPLLAQMYAEATSVLAITSPRDEAIWRYLLQHTIGNDMEGDFWLMLDDSAQPVAYGRTMRFGFGKGLILSETSRMNIAQAHALLHYLKGLAKENNKPSIRFNLPVSNPVLRLARTWGAVDSGTYAWQIHLVDVAGLLRKLTPVLERRIAASAFAGFTRKVNLNLYRETFELNFEQGKLLSVNNIGFREGDEIRIPPLLLAPLLLGYRSREELRQSHPDVSIWGQSQYLIDVLFPKLDSFIFTMY